MICAKKTVPIGQRSMIFQKHRVIIREILRYSVRNFHSGRRSVFCKRHFSKSQHRLRHDRPGQRHTAYRKCSGIHGMGVYHRFYIFPLLINSHMHFYFRRRPELSICFEYIPLGIHLTDILRRHKSLAHSGWRAQKLIIAQFHRKVAVISRNHSPVVHSFPNLTHLLFYIHFTLHYYRLLFWFFVCSDLILSHNPS